MFVKFLVFNADGGLFNIFGKSFDFDGVAFFLGINLIEQFAVAVENFCADGSRKLGEFGGIGDVFEEPNKKKK